MVKTAKLARKAPTPAPKAPTSRAKQADRMTAAKADKVPTDTGAVTVLKLSSSNGGHITIAELSNGKVEPIDKIQRAGIQVKPGQVWADVQLAYKVKVRPKPVGHLANGVESRTNPNSAKAVQDNKRAAAGATKATAKTAPTKTTKKVEAKAKRAERAAPKGDDARKITILKKDFTFGREGTVRHDSWVAATKAKTVQEYLAAGGKAKYLPRWANAGAIKLG